METNKKVAGNGKGIPVPTSANSVELALHKAGVIYAFIKPNQKFLGEGKTHNIQDLDGPHSAVPGKHYQLLFYLDHSGPLVFPDSD